MEVAAFIQYIGNAAGHAGSEIAPGGADDHDPAAGHVFAAMIADRFDDGVDAAVADAEPFAGHAANVGLAARRAIEGDVAGDNIFLRHEGRSFGWIDNYFAAGETFAEIIVGVAFQNPSHAVGHKSAEALAGGTFEMDLN